ncbi:protein phosphatase [Sulfolobales archaeon HS-7]|nr:protein phosphatase [Sulfolobales archaeon HS-7]
MMNLFWLNDRIAGSDVPANPNDLNYIKRKRIDRVVSLVTDEELEEVWGSVFNYRRELNKRGIELLRFPIADGGAPSVEQSLEIVQYLEQGKRTLIHCLGGMGRTGTVLAAYLIFKGINAQTAIERIRLIRPGAIQTVTQEYFLINLERIVRNVFRK